MTTNDTPEIRAYYLECMRALYSKKTNNSVLLDRQEYNTKLDRLIELENPLEKRMSSDSRLAKMCIIAMPEPDGLLVSRLCKRGTNLPYVPLEDLFDVIHNAHVNLNHAGRNGLQRHFRDRYANITKDCIMTYLNTCIDCPRTKRAGHLIRRRVFLPNFASLSAGNDLLSFSACGDDDDDDDFEPFHSPSSGTGFDNEQSFFQNVVNDNSSFLSTTSLNIPQVKSLDVALKVEEQHSAANIVSCKREFGKKNNKVNCTSDDKFSRGQVDVFGMTLGPDGEFKFIMRYTNLSTREIRLCALRSTSVVEVSDALVDIYCEQGAPVVLQSLNGREFVTKTINEVVKLWPRCRQLHAEFCQIDSARENVSLKEAEYLLIEQLLKVMKENDVSSWVCALRFLQWKLNTTVNAEIGRSPMEIKLGRVPALGLKSSKLLDAIYDKARSEEQILEFLQDAELLRLSAFCQQSSSTTNFNFLAPPEKRSRTSLQHVDDALNGKMFCNNGFILANTAASTTTVSSTPAITNTTDKKHSQGNNFLNHLNNGSYSNSATNSNLRPISAQQQRNNVNNFVQRISQRFLQQRSRNENNISCNNNDPAQPHNFQESVALDSNQSGDEESNFGADMSIKPSLRLDRELEYLNSFINDISNLASINDCSELSSPTGSDEMPLIKADLRTIKSKFSLNCSNDMENAGFIS